MKILFINSVCGAGSTGRICTDLYNVLEGAGHQCCIAYGRGKAPEGYCTIKIGNKVSVYLHAILSRFSDRQGFYSKYATKKLIKEIEGFSPDIIHLHNMHGYYINIQCLFQFLAKSTVKVVWTLHDCWAFTGHCTHFTFLECNKWKSQCFSCIQKNKYPKSLWRDNSWKNFKIKKSIFTSLEEKQLVLVSPSLWLSKQVKESFLGNYRIEVINNGIDISRFHPFESEFRKKNNLNNKKLVLGVANIWDVSKGLSSLLELSQDLNDDFKIVVVGKSSKKLKRKYKAILWINHTESIKELAEIYSACDVFVNPTLEDNFPTTNLEALACGTPVITYDTGGSSESLTFSCGEVIEYKNYKALKDAVQKIVCVPADKCVCQARNFTKENMFEEYKRVYSITQE